MTVDELIKKLQEISAGGRGSDRLVIRARYDGFYYTVGAFDSATCETLAGFEAQYGSEGEKVVFLTSDSSY